MDSKLKRYDKLYMDIATSIGNMSYAKKLKVGTLAVKDGNVLSMGFNGTPSGWDNNCEDTIYTDHESGYRLKTKPEVIHSEANMVCKAARDGVSLMGATAYVTIAPCVNCALLMLQSGISRLVFKDYYKTDLGIEILKKSNIKVDKYENS